MLAERERERERERESVSRAVLQCDRDDGVGNDALTDGRRTLVERTNGAKERDARQRTGEGSAILWQAAILRAFILVPGHQIVGLGAVCSCGDVGSCCRNGGVRLWGCGAVGLWGCGAVARWGGGAVGL